MTAIGWEFWGLKFSWFLTALLTIGMTLYIWLRGNLPGDIRRVDTMCGDEGEEW